MEFVINPKTNRRVKNGSRKYVELLKQYQGREDELFNYKPEKKKYVKKTDIEKKKISLKDLKEIKEEEEEEEKSTSCMSAPTSGTDIDTTTDREHEAKSRYEDVKEEVDDSIFIKNPKDNGDKLYNYINYMVMKKINEMLASE